MTAVSVALLTVTAAPAQEQELEEIVVTGSRIARPDFESASPIVTIGEDRFEQTASPTVESVLTSMPQFVGSWGSTSNNPGAGGQTTASLRGLGEVSTLVLLEGRRLVPADGRGVPDLNLIPPSLVERVEIVTGGASAVYGSDALAGVVNFHLRQDYDGFEVDGNWGETSHGDGQSYTVNLTAGTPLADGRGSLMGVLGYSERDLVTQGDRKFSRVALGYYGPGTDGVGPGGDFLPLGSSLIEEGRVTFAPSAEAFDALYARYGYPAGTVPYQREFSFNTDGTLFTMGNGEPGSVANFRDEQDPLTFNDRRYSYNYAPPNALQLPLERTSVFVNGRYELGESAELYAQGLFGDYSVSQRLAPTPVGRVYMPPTNPYIPPDLKFLLDSRANPAARIQFSKRTLELGARLIETDYSVYQATLGLRGTVWSDWDYEAYAQYGRNAGEQLSTGVLSVSKFEELLYAPDGGQSICGGLDPFGLDSISRECAEYMAVEVRDRQTVEQFTAEFSLSGKPAELPAGPLKTVFGVFFKEDEYSLRPDELASAFLPDGRSEVSGYTGGQAAVDGDDHNLDLYVEALVPVMADAPGVRSLQAVFGYRYSDYASAGGAESYKAELLYAPVDAVRLRGSFQRAVRAPSVFELYNPQLPGFPYVEPPDPCNVGSPQRTGRDAAAVEALCLAQGMSPELLAVFNYQDRAVEGFWGGNPDLEPEEAETYTLGVVFNSPFEPAWLENLQVSLDWYNINIADSIAYLPANLFVPHCYDPMFNPDFDPANHYCSYFERDPETGVIVDAYEILRNIAGVETSGVDLQVDWRVGAGPGEVSVTWLVAWVDSYVFQAEQEVKGVEGVNTGCCPTLPEWKWNLNASYRVRSMTFAATWQHVGSFKDWFERDFDIPAKDYLDLTATYAFEEGTLDGLTLRAGVTNALDELPPIFPTYQQANTEPSVFDVLGRRYFVGVRYSWSPSAR